MSGGALARPGDRAAGVMQLVADELRRKAPTLTHLLPKEITAERMRALALTSIRKNPALLKCTPESIVGCVYEACKIGLTPDTASADCHLVPYGKEATFLLGYRGMLKLVRRAVPMAMIKAEHVRQADHFVWVEGLEPKLEHVRAAAGEREKTPITHAYAIARFPNGMVEFKVVDAGDIARARKTARSTAWQHHEGEMWCKTALKRISKTLPLDDPAARFYVEAMSRAIDLDSAAEDERDQDLMGDAPLEGEIIDAPIVGEDEDEDPTSKDAP